MGRFTLYKTDDAKYVEVGTWYKKERVIAVKYEFREIKDYNTIWTNEIKDTTFQLSFGEIDKICRQCGFNLVLKPYYLGSMEYYIPIIPYSIYVREDQIDAIENVCKQLSDAEKKKEDRVKKYIEEENRKKIEAERIKQDRINRIPFKDTYCGGEE